MFRACSGRWHRHGAERDAFDMASLPCSGRPRLIPRRASAAPNARIGARRRRAGMLAKCISLMSKI